KQITTAIDNNKKVFLYNKAYEVIKSTHGSHVEYLIKCTMNDYHNRLLDNEISNYNWLKLNSWLTKTIDTLEGDNND
ncbi:MAG: hypothetical protein DRR06_19790, partial [Gammaproteobacteria bacterium]